ncbi:hypothetical protein ACFVRR_18115 [Gottfriedia sp. NPDC057948]|uniref:hypothetical protein n=1 Tax=Gottfriedia sp. NPDC057948 TaxID=3346287 RepID=UPI0036DD2C93
MIKKLKIPLAIALGVSLGSSLWIGHAVAANKTQHSIGSGSVDSKEIRWGSSTKYTANRDYAIKIWNALGKVKIAPDTATTIEDLTFKDVNLPDETFTAQWVPRIGADRIEFNTPKFNNSGRTTAAKNKTASHELGHALGIGDHYESNYSGLIMYGYSSSTTTLQAHDKTDYNANWKN